MSERRLPQLRHEGKRTALIPVQGRRDGADYETMSVEELMRTKEPLEDLIAEKEMQEQSVTVEAAKA